MAIRPAPTANLASVRITRIRARACATGRPFKILRAEPIEGIDYGDLYCPGMFVGHRQFSSGLKAWPIARMFSGFSWPGGGLDVFGHLVPWVGDADFTFRVWNESDEPRPFQIKLVGLELA